MKYLFFTLLLIFPLGQLGRVIYLNDFATLFVVLVWLILTKGKNVIGDPLLKPLAVFVGVMILSLFLNIFDFPIQKILISSLYIWRFVIYACLYFVAKDLFKEHKTIEKLMSLAAIVVAIVGIGQFVLLPDVSFLKEYEWDDHYYRAVSTFLDPGFTGAILALGLILSLSQKSIFRSVTIYIALALTYSRASYLMYLVSLGIFSFYKQSIKIFLIALMVLVITIPLLPVSSGEGTKLQRENSITARINNWNQTLEVWEKNPILGVGFNTYKYVSNTSFESHSGGADSSLFLVLATTGIIGFAAYIYLLKKTWDMGNFIFKASLGGIIVHSFFNNTLFYPWVMEWLWILLALFPNSKKQT